MKFFKHDTNAKRNPKIRKVLRIHGPTGGFIWWAILEELYLEDENGFQIHANELWLENLAEDCHISDPRTLTRVLDTFSEVGLIDAQLWQENYIHVEAIKERGDRYIEKKALNAKRQAAFRAKNKTSISNESVTSDSEVSNALLTDDETVSNSETQKVTPSDIRDQNTEYRNIEMSFSSKNDAKKTSTPKSKLKGAELYLSKSSDEHRERFESWWAWYKKISNELGSSPGSKAAAAKVWANLGDGFDYEKFRTGCVAWSKQSKQKSQFGPHGSIFLKGKPGHEDPYWVAALDLVRQESADGFEPQVSRLPTKSKLPSVPLISKEKAAELDARPLHLLEDDEHEALKAYKRARYEAEQANAQEVA